MAESKVLDGDNVLKDRIKEQLFSVEYLPMVDEDEMENKNHTRVSISSIAALGSSFTQLNQKGVYKAVFPEGVHGTLAKAKDGSGNLGTIINEKGIAGQARFVEVAMNPTQLFMAAALVNIDQKLNEIQEMQKGILDFLVQDKEAKIKGDLSTLADIFNNYKLNWNSEQYTNLKLNLIQDIKRDAKNNVIFYERQIKEYVAKEKLVHTNKHIKEKLNNLQKQFKYYKLSNYMYSFASFLEVMLLGNFSEEYVENIIKDLEKHSFQYRALYTECYDKLEQKAKTSIESRFLNIASKVDKFTGETISKNKNLSKTRADEFLLKSGDALEKQHIESVGKTMEQFNSNRYDGSFVFISNLRTIKTLYNEPLELYFDSESVYLNN